MSALCILHWPSHTLSREAWAAPHPLQGCPGGLHRGWCKAPPLLSLPWRPRATWRSTGSREAVQWEPRPLASWPSCRLPRAAASSLLPLQICSQIVRAFHSNPTSVPHGPSLNALRALTLHPFPDLSLWLSLSHPSRHADPHCFLLARHMPHLSRAFAPAAHLAHTQGLS